MKIKITVLVEDSVRKRGLVAQHGLSMLVEILKDDKELTVLMDTGQDAEILLKNADILGVDLELVDVIVLSHGHYDHAGGLIGVLKEIGRPIPVIAHPKAFEGKFASKPHLRYIGVNYTLKDVRNAGGIPVLSKTPVHIFDGVSTTGEIERTTSFEVVEGFLRIEGERLVEDEIPDCQSLIMWDEEDLVVLTGCAHAGVVNTIKHAMQISKAKKLKAVIGGFHLEKASEQRIKLTIEEISKFNSEIVAPMHCTGFRATAKIAEAFNKQFKLLKTGSILEL